MIQRRVRGIYTTALTKLLLDNGFEIVQPSPTIKKRLDLPDNSAAPDLRIRDRYDLQGIRALGTPEAASAFRSVLQLAFDDAITRKWHATIECISDKLFEYCRVMRSSGTYDGLDVEKEIGDMAISEAEIGEWWIKTEYFSSDGELKWTYINLNTPVEIYPKAIRYVDLEVGKCIPPVAAAEDRDREKLKKAFKRGFIGKRLLERIMGKAIELAETRV